MINTEKTVLSPRIERKIEQLHQDKIRINKEKIDHSAIWISMIMDSCIFLILPLNPLPMRTAGYTG